MSTTILPALAPASVSSPGKAKASAKVKEPKSPEPKKLCPGGCDKEYNAKTIDKNGGMCARCSKKNTASEKSPTAKQPCPGGCGKEYTAATLKKNPGGVCGRCVQKQAKENGEEVLASSGEAKVKCPECPQFYLPKTLEEAGGVCKRCQTKKAKALAESGVVPVDPKAKAVCQGPCGKEMYKKTLDNGGGICGRCRQAANKPASTGKGVKAQATTSGVCKGCAQPFQQSTLDKNQGNCPGCAGVTKPASPKLAPASPKLAPAPAVGKVKAPPLTAGVKLPVGPLVGKVGLAKPAPALGNLKFPPMSLKPVAPSHPVLDDEEGGEEDEN